MLGWFRTPAALASCSNRLRRSPSAEKDAGRTLIATSRFRRGSRARYTSPIPPAPRGDRTSYGPRRLPAAIVISARSKNRNPKSESLRSPRFGGFGKAEAPDQLLITRIGAQRVELAVGGHPRGAVGAFRLRAPEPLDCAVPIPQPGIDRRDLIGTDIALLRSLRQLVDHFASFGPIARGRIRSSEHFQDRRAVVEASRLLESRDGLRIASRFLVREAEERL